MLGFGTRLSFAFRCFFVLLFKGRLPYDVAERFRAELTPEAPPPPPVPPEDPGHRAVQLLAILQRDGRLVDFLEEDIAPYNDAQVGAAVRDVHANCRAALARYLTLEPVLAEAEGEQLRAVGTDVTRVKLIGAVSSSGEQSGVVRHRGWRVTHLALPSLPREDARSIVAPAEIEVA
jgi:Domain of unknown function (DUF2760)